MADQSIIEAAKQAYLKIDDENQRHLFIHWCREQNNRAFMREVVRATEAGLSDLKEAANIAGETAVETGAAALETGKDLGQKTADAAKRVAKTFDEKMRELLGGNS